MLSAYKWLIDQKEVQASTSSHVILKWVSFSQSPPSNAPSMERDRTVEKDDNAVLENEEREELVKYNINGQVKVRVIFVVDGHFCRASTSRS